MRVRDDRNWSSNTTIFYAAVEMTARKNRGSSLSQKIAEIREGSEAGDHNVGFTFPFLVDAVAIVPFYLPLQPATQSSIFFHIRPSSIKMCAKSSQEAVVRASGCVRRQALGSAIRLLLGLEVVEENGALLRLLTPVLDDNARAVDDLAGVALAVDLACE